MSRGRIKIVHPSCPEVGFEFSPLRCPEVGLEFCILGVSRGWIRIFSFEVSRGRIIILHLRGVQRLDSNFLFDVSRGWIRIFSFDVSRGRRIILLVGVSRGRSRILSPGRPPLPERKHRSVSRRNSQESSTSWAGDPGGGPTLTKEKRLPEKQERRSRRRYRHSAQRRSGCSITYYI